MKLFSEFPRNARYMLLCEPLWAIFGGMLFFYMPLYMKDIGLSDIQIGTINTIGLFTSFIFFLVAAPLTNKYGRRKTTLIGDLISWGVPMIIWAVAQNFWYFFAAATINSVVKIVFVSWNSLMVEDTPKEMRSRVYSIMYIINTINGVLTPITGLFISRFGTVSTMRVIFLAGFVTMIPMFLIRNAFVRETEAGLRLMKEHSELTLFQSLKVYSQNLISVFHDRANIIFAVIFTVLSFTGSFNFFQVIYLNEQLLISEGSISLAPGVNSVIGILVYILVLKRMSRQPEYRMLSISLALSMLGAISFILIPQRSIPSFLAAMAILSIGNLFTQAFLHSAFMNRLGENEKADAYSGMMMLTAAAGIPSGYLGGLLYTVSPIMPFMINCVLYASIALLALMLGRIKPGVRPGIAS